MKNLLYIILAMTMILHCQSAFADAAIFSGSDVKILKSNLDFNGGIKVLSASTDPTSSATSANRGSILCNTGGGNCYVKQDSGSSTNWNRLIFGNSSGVVAVAQGGTNTTSYTKGDILVASSSSVLSKLAVGTNGRVLMASSDATTGVAWEDVGSVVSSSFALANWPITVGQYGDITSISLTPGTWSVGVHGSLYSNGAVITTYCTIGVSTTSGNSSSGLTFGTTMVTQTKTAATDTRDSFALSNLIFTVTSTTTHYLKGYCDASITNLQVGVRITAVRIK